MEMLLFYAVPHRDTNPTAHRLLSHFGSLDGVFSAPVNELEKVDGVGPYVAAFLRFYGSISEYAVAQRECVGVKIVLPEDYGRFFVDYFSDVRVSRTVLLLLDNASRVLDLVVLADAHFTSPLIGLRTLMEPAIQRRAAFVVLAHNHVGKSELPDPADIELNAYYKDQLSASGITLYEHIIVSGERYARLMETVLGIASPQKQIGGGSY